MSRRIDLVWDDDGDWCGTYLDGKLLDEGHSPRIGVILDALDVDWDRSVDEKLGEERVRCLPFWPPVPEDPGS